MLYKTIPASIDATNINALGCPAAALTTAGPGQKPESPQPMPKTRLPISKPLSSPVTEDSCIGAPNKLRLRFLATVKAAAPISTAPPMTNARDGSQAPAKSRKPMTFDGSVMPEMIRPKPNNRPTRKALRFNMVIALSNGESDRR